MVATADYGGITYAAPIVWGTNKYVLLHNAPGPWEKQIIRTLIPGVDGAVVKEHGHMGRLISTQVLYMNTSEANVMAAIAGDQDTLEGLLSFTATLPSGTHENCTEGRIVQKTDATWRVASTGTGYWLVECLVSAREEF